MFGPTDAATEHDISSPSCCFLNKFVKSKKSGSNTEHRWLRAHFRIDFKILLFSF